MRERELGASGLAVRASGCPGSRWSWPAA